jgi:putative phage-type endonuclease
MPATTTQLEQRRSRIGSSDMAAILGLDTYRNAYDVWLEKTGKLDPEKESDNDPRAAGKILEPAILTFGEQWLGPITRNQFRSARDKGLPIGALVDAIVNESGAPVEAKTSGLYGFTNDVWGDEGTDQVPDRVIIQSHVHMLCTDAEVCYVPVFIAFRGFVKFIVPRDAAIIDVISNEARRFWDDHVLADTPPSNLTPNLAVVKRIRREPSKTVEIPQELVDQWLGAKAEKSAAEKIEKAHLAEVLAALGDAEAGTCATGQVTYFEQTRKEFISPESTFRVARFKKAK